MTKLLVDLHVQKHLANAITQRFAAVESWFFDAARETNHEDVMLIVESFDSSTENAILKVSDPYTRSWDTTLEKSLYKAWDGMAGEVKDLVSHVEKPTIIFSTSITS